MVASWVSNVMLSGRPQEVPSLFDTVIAHGSDVVTASLISPTGHISASSSPALLGTIPWANLGRFDDSTVIMAPGGRESEYAVVQPILNAVACARCHGTASRVNGWLDLRFTRAPVLAAQSQLARTLSLSAAAAFVVLMAGPGIPGDSTLMLQSAAMRRSVVSSRPARCIRRNSRSAGSSSMRTACGR